MRPLPLIALLACKGEIPEDSAPPVDSGGPAGPTRDRREGEDPLSVADATLRGAPGDEAGTAGVGGRAWALAVGAPQRDEGVGLVAVFAALPEGEAGVDEADALLVGAEASGFAGASLVALGASGLAHGAFWDGRGGAQAGAVALFADPLARPTPGAVRFGDPGDLLGLSLAELGDQDGDGVVELVMGGHGADLDERDAGRVTLLPADAEGQGLAAEAPTQLFGAHYLGWFGVSVDAGDLDGDGVEDLVVGAMGEPGQAASAGVVHAFFGPLSGQRQGEDDDLRVRGEASWGAFGKAVASGVDVDGDGRHDLLAAAPDQEGGVVVLFLGGAEGALELADARARLTAEGEADRAGFSLTLVEDHDGDGHGDLLIGATRTSQGEAFAAGSAYLVYGPLEGTRSLAEADWILRGLAEEDRAGISVADGGDLDGDGFPELLIGARGARDGAGEAAGALYVLR